MNRKIWSIGFLLLAVITARAELQRSVNSESLRDLNGIFVVSQFVDAQPEGMNPNSVETKVKLALQDAGIPLDAEPKKADGDANLSITVSAIKNDQLGLYLFTVELAVTQDVRLARQARLTPLSANTWSRSIQGLTSPDRTDVIEQALKQEVKLFVTEYRAMNPTKP